MRIVATMIVKNEAHVIARCLESVLPLVDCVCICDTGSTDGTYQAVFDALTAVPDTGQPIKPPREPIVPFVFLREPWENFGVNRTMAFRAAEDQFGLTAQDWHLVIDADDVLELRATPNGIRFALENLKHDSYSLEVHHDNTLYRRLHFFRADGSWTYQGPVHEHPQRTQGEANSGELHPEAIIYRFLGGGGRSLVPQAEKYSADAALLAAHLAQDPSNSRSAFYLAQSLRDAGRDHEAVVAYLKRACMPGWEQEAYYSFLQAGRMLRSRCLECVGVLQRAHLRDPARAEAAYELASVHEQCYQQDPTGEDARDYLVTAYLWAEIAATRPAPSKDALFVEPQVWEWSRNLAAQLRGGLTGG